MARYIDADVVNQEIDKLQTELGSNDDTIWNRNKKIYKGLCYARGIIGDTPTADVVPKSEVDTWYQLYHSIKEELKMEKMYHRETENLCDRYCIESQHAKEQVAREIFEEIDRYVIRGISVHGDNLTLFNGKNYAELKKKYIKGD